MNLQFSNNNDGLIQIGQNYGYNANYASAILLNLEKNNFFSSIFHYVIFVNIK